MYVCAYLSISISLSIHMYIYIYIYLKLVVDGHRAELVLDDGELLVLRAADSLNSLQTALTPNRISVSAASLETKQADGRLEPLAPIRTCGAVPLYTVSRPP